MGVKPSWWGTCGVCGGSVVAEKRGGEGGWLGLACINMAVGTNLQPSVQLGCRWTYTLCLEKSGDQLILSE